MSDPPRHVVRGCDKKKWGGGGAPTPPQDTGRGKERTEPFIAPHVPPCRCRPRRGPPRAGGVPSGGGAAVTPRQVGAGQDPALHPGLGDGCQADDPPAGAVPRHGQCQRWGGGQTDTRPGQGPPRVPLSPQNPLSLSPPDPWDPPLKLLCAPPNPPSPPNPSGPFPRSPPSTPGTPLNPHGPPTPKSASQPHAPPNPTICPSKPTSPLPQLHQPSPCPPQAPLGLPQDPPCPPPQTQHMPL